MTTRTIRTAFKYDKINQDVTLDVDMGEELRITVKLCINQIKKSGIIPEPNTAISTIFTLLDWCRNCGAEPLADEVLSYVGILPTAEFKFKLVYDDNLHLAYNHRRLPENQNPYVKMRTYKWKQIDNSDHH